MTPLPEAQGTRKYLAPYAWVLTSVSPRPPFPPHTLTLNLTTGREKWSSDRPRSITRSAQWNSGSPGASSGRISGGSVFRWKATERSQFAFSQQKAG